MVTEKIPRISIITAADDELLDAQRWFHALANQTLTADAYEVLIVDASHHTDHQPAFIRFRDEGLLGPNITFHRTALGGRALAINHGLSMAQSELIAILGDDCGCIRGRKSLAAARGLMHFASSWRKCAGESREATGPFKSGGNPGLMPPSPKDTGKAIDANGQ